MGFGIKRDKYDAVVSDLVRYRDSWKCQRCNKIYEPKRFDDDSKRSTGLEAAHFRSRVHKSTRYDLDNIDALCSGCHSYFGRNQHEHRIFKIARDGLGKVELIEYKARHPLKMNRNEKEILYQDLKHQLEEEILKYERRFMCHWLNWRRWHEETTKTLLQTVQAVSSLGTSMRMLQGR
jgi:hypothetical protein